MTNEESRVRRDRLRVDDTLAHDGTSHRIVEIRQNVVVIETRAPADVAIEVRRAGEGPEGEAS